MMCPLKKPHKTKRVSQMINHTAKVLKLILALFLAFLIGVLMACSTVDVTTKDGMKIKYWNFHRQWSVVKKGDDITIRVGNSAVDPVVINTIEALIGAGIIGSGVNQL